MPRFNINWLIVVPLLVLVSIGFMVQASIGLNSRGYPININLTQQALALVAGLFIGRLAARTSRHKLETAYKVAYVIVLIMLLAVLVFSPEINGSKRWLSVGGFQVQPSEFMKPILVLILARMFSGSSKKTNTLFRLIQAAGLTMLPIVLIVIEPDLGSAIVLGVIFAGIVYSSRLAMSRLGLLAVGGVLTVALAVPFLADYQQQRLVSYFNPSTDSAGSNYNVSQAKIAIGSGGVWGKGLDAGTQSQLNFIPAQNTDFIFAVTAEKLGIVGASAVVLSLCLLTTIILWRAWSATDIFKALCFLGVASFMFFHSFINIGMNLGLVPVTGLPLPFISYGGSFMLTCSAAIGFVMFLDRS